MHNALIRAAKRATRRPNAKIIVQGPLGQEAIAFNTERIKAIGEAENTVMGLDDQDGCMVTPMSVNFDQNYRQGIAKSVEAIVRNQLPNRKLPAVSVVAGIDVTTEGESSPSLPSFVLSITDDNNLKSAFDSIGYNWQTASMVEFEEALERVLLSTVLLQCFPFSAILAGKERARFFMEISTTSGAKDGLTRGTGVPPKSSTTIIPVWFDVFQKLYGVGKQSLTPDSAAQFIANTWPKIGGAISETTLSKLLAVPQNIDIPTSLYNHSQNPSNQRVLDAILEGEASLYLTRRNPNAQNRQRIVGLFNFPSFALNRLGVLTKESSKQKIVKLLIEQSYLVPYDATNLRSAALMLSS